MTGKIHQHSNTTYQIRVNGSPVAHWPSVDSYFLDEFTKVCYKNQKDFVDIVSVRTEILMNQFTYNQMKKHFAEKQNEA